MHFDDDEEEDDMPHRPEPPKEETVPVVPVSPLGERLLKARTIIISGGISQKVAESVMGQLVALTADSNDPITIYVNSQGGHVEAGDTIHDMIRFVAAPVRMIGTGWVAS